MENNPNRPKDSTGRSIEVADLDMSNEANRKTVMTQIDEALRLLDDYKKSGMTESYSTFATEWKEKKKQDGLKVDNLESDY